MKPIYFYIIISLVSLQVFSQTVITGKVTQKLELKGDTIRLNIQLKEAFNQLTAVTITAGTFEAGDKKQAVTDDKRTYCIDYALDQLEPMLDPETYFRINRKYIVSINACTNILAWSNSRLRLKIEGADDPDIIVARERVQEFKNWLDR